MTMPENETLEQHQKLEGRVNRMTYLINDFATCCQYLQSFGDAGKPTMQKISAYIRKYKAEINQCRLQQQAIADMVQCIPDERHQRIIRKHYLQGMTWEQVAESEFVVIRQIYRIRQQALLSFELIEKVPPG